MVSYIITMPIHLQTRPAPLNASNTKCNANCNCHPDTNANCNCDPDTNANTNCHSKTYSDTQAAPNSKDPPNASEALKVASV